MVLVGGVGRGVENVIDIGVLLHEFQDGGRDFGRRSWFSVAIFEFAILEKLGI
jgi:hypothetical protein